MAFIGRSGRNDLALGGSIPDDEILDAVDESYLPVVSRLTFDAADPAALCVFWCEALGHVVELPPTGVDTWDAPGGQRVLPGLSARFAGSPDVVEH